MAKIRISPYQLASLIVICRIHTLMTHIPFIGNGFSAASEIMGAVLSALLCALIVIPSCIFYKRHKNTGLISAISEKHKFLAVILGAIALCAVILPTAENLSEFMAFSSERFAGDIPTVLILFLLILVCLYAAYCGIEGIARSSSVTLLLFGIMLVMMFSGSIGKFSLENIRTGLSEKDMLSSFIDDLKASAELIPLIFCGKYVTEKYPKAAYGSLFIRLLLTAGITLSAAAVLGDYAFISRYPFLDIGSAAGIRFFQRIDALYIIVWTVTAVISLSLRIFTAGEIFREMFPSFRYGHAVSAVLTLFCLFSRIGGAAVLICLTAAAAPIFAAIIIRERKEHEQQKFS